MKTILLVEDMEDDVFFLKRVLKQSDIPNPVQVVSDGQQAIDYLEGKGIYADREQHPLPLLVLLDLKLPYVMGFEVLKWIRARTEFDKVLVAVLTSSPHDRDIKETYRLGGNFYLIKPSTGTKLVELMDALKVNRNWRSDLKRPVYD